MLGRKFNSGNYRFGFNGQEEDLETGTINYKYREYDPRVIRFPSVDPITSQYPELTPYQHSSLSPIWMIELEGVPYNDDGEPEGLVDLPKGIFDLDMGLDKQSQLAAKRPFEAIKVGLCVWGTSNLVESLALDDVYTKRRGINDGPLTNTFRHALGQALVTYSYGADIAKDWGDAHEGDFAGIFGNVNAVDFEGNSTGLEVMDAIERDGFALMRGGFDLADSYVDLNNNMWGRFAGSMYSTIKNSGSTDLLITDLIVDEMAKGRLLVLYPNQSNMPQEFRDKIPEGFSFDNDFMFIAPVKLNLEQRNEIKAKMK